MSFIPKVVSKSDLAFLDHCSDAFLGHQVVPATWASRFRMFTVYLSLCSSSGVDPLPVTARKVTRSLTLRFLTRVPMSARSLRTLKSNLKRCVTKGLHRPWLS